MLIIVLRVEKSKNWKTNGENLSAASDLERFKNLMDSTSPKEVF
jgi:hypothetical protein